MTTPTSNTPATAAETSSFGQIGYDAYGSHPGTHGAWKTFDGRPMPRWPEYTAAGPGSSGALTQERWEAAAQAIIEAYERRKAAAQSRSGLIAATIQVDASQAMQTLAELESRATSVCATLENIEQSEALDEGRIDPFLMGISEIAAATRDLAEAERALAACDESDGPVAQLITDVTEALHSRVKALAHPPSDA
ncbi:hypothetical protein F0U60_37555 [Archangium minus]|uniref:Uncharacterized protein n=1 Tax=Archangium minus TaxID=83450 RepID=A0ABY9X1B4_9BACT|nr:hypothetical protein F0U60_37555 [Archangium minus]